MQCKKCDGKLEVYRQCRQIRMKCRNCHQEYHIHEVAADLDEETEKLLERYTCIIYD